jgi:26S proteasome regulatory subunit N1
MLKEKLELLVERLSDKDQAQVVYAMEQLKQEISGATKTMTSVPKPLKFLSPHYAAIKAAYEAQTDATLKVSRLLDCRGDLTKVLRFRQDART